MKTSEIWIAVLAVILSVFLSKGFVFSVTAQNDSISNQQNRSFVIDCDGNQFLKDGRPYRYIAGEIQYFKTQPVYWKHRLMQMKAAGINALQTYIEWRMHEPTPGVYNFKGQANLVAYLKLAQSLGLDVILRLGPFIDAERDMGGLPWWLMSNNYNIPLRQYNQEYLQAVDRWYSVLLPLLKPLLYENGGPIIMAQIENEYGSYYACDQKYLLHLRNFVRNYLGENVVLYTTDGWTEYFLRCGKIPGVYATVDFGTEVDAATAFQNQKKFEKCGPSVNSEFYPGWIDLWGREHQTIATEKVIKTLTDMLNLNASAVLYVFFGGTNFGVSSGAVPDRLGYVPCVSSYDFDAPVTEAGDLTPKYHAIRQLLQQHGFAVGTPPPKIPKFAYGPVTLSLVANMFTFLDFAKDPASIFTSENSVMEDRVEYPEWLEWIETSSSIANTPITMEKLNFGYGFILLNITVTDMQPDPTILEFTDNMRDRAYIYIDQNQMVGIIQRDSARKIPISISKGQTLQILVENLGRLAYKDQNDPKGITSSVKLNGNELTGFNVIKIPFDDQTWFMQAINHYTKMNIKTMENNINSAKHFKGRNLPTPALFEGAFKTPSTLNESQDTFIDMTGWKKGYVWINSFLLGRYWPAEGPQVTLYVPKNVLKAPGHTNHIKLLEMQYANFKDVDTDSALVTFLDYPILNGSVPLSRSNYS